MLTCVDVLYCSTPPLGALSSFFDLIFPLLSFFSPSFCVNHRISSRFFVSHNKSRLHILTKEGLFHHRSTFFFSYRPSFNSRFWRRIASQPGTSDSELILSHVIIGKFTWGFVFVKKKNRHAE
jgi:hypothetical protein